MAAPLTLSTCKGVGHSALQGKGQHSSPWCASRATTGGPSRARGPLTPLPRRPSLARRPGGRWRVPCCGLHGGGARARVQLINNNIRGGDVGKKIHAVEDTRADQFVQCRIQCTHSAYSPRAGPTRSDNFAASAQGGRTTPHAHEHQPTCLPHPPRPAPRLHLTCPGNGITAPSRRGSYTLRPRSRSYQLPAATSSPLHVLNGSLVDAARYFTVATSRCTYSLHRRSRPSPAATSSLLKRWVGEGRGVSL